MERIVIVPVEYLLAKIQRILYLNPPPPPPSN
jgi:hypothetical protein